MKRTLLVLLLGLLLLAVPAAMRAQGEHYAAPYYYDINADHTVTITEYVGRGGAVAIPDTLGGLTVTTIGDSAFSYGYSFYITSVTIPNSVTSIGEYAFEGCTGLIKLTIGHSVTNIESFAFSACTGLRSTLFEGNAPSVGTDAFFEVENAPAYYLAGTSGWDTNDVLGATLWNPPTETGSLRVTISPVSAITVGGQWQVDDGTTNDSGATVSDLSVGIHTVSFTAIPGWNPLADQAVTIKKGVTTKTSGVYKLLPPPSAALILLTNGYGTIQHGAWPKSLVIGRNYTVTGVAKSRNGFSNWVASGSQSFIATNASLTFTMISDLVLQANFVTNVFLAAQGTYKGLFVTTNAARQQEDSGSFLFNVTSGGIISGSLDLNTTTEVIAHDEGQW